MENKTSNVMMDKITHSLYIIALLILASCVKVEYDTDDVDEDFVLITNWDDRSEGINIPESYKLRINDTERTLYELTNSLKLDKGDYKLLVYNTAGKVNIDGDVFTVETNNGVVNNKPDWFFLSSLNVNIPKDLNSRKTAYMQQEIRQLKIIFSIRNGNINLIDEMQATLSGVANQININSEVIGSAVSTTLKFELQANRMVATIRILGIYPTAEQILKTAITANGETKIIETDLTELLKEFNKNKSTPLTLNANIDLEISGSQPGFTATIEGWKEDSEDIEVD